ncbi:Uncharacterised protein [Mycobacteroides abscessus subsp. massiliense]|nr:Uncharacterised protein [Mycobacteroides abscessus subsp. massiliense]
MAFDSDCFSQASARTRRYLPDCTRLAATTPVDPPTDPAVCTRIIGFPVAPIASAMKSSGIMTPSKKSGALPTTTASISSQSTPASVMARSMASRTRPFMETSCRLATYFVCPVPMTAARFFDAPMFTCPPAPRRGSAVAPVRWSRVPVPAVPNHSRYVVRQNRSAPARQRTSDWPRGRHRTG